VISEPELVGDDGEIPPPTDVVADETGPARGRLPWTWAVGGALVASVLWAAGFAVFGGGGGPDTRGYAMPGDLCEVTEARHLVAAIGRRDVQHRAASRNEALDRAWCDLEFAGRHVHGGVSVYLELHKEADPSAEFKALSTQNDWAPPVEPVREISGLGDEAYLGFSAYGDGMRLSVREGSSVVRMELSVSRWDEVPFDFESVVQPLTEDMKQLMARLKGQS
jgi:hypothetical protein